MTNKNKSKRDILLETNIRLQETSQKLLTAKQELEKKNEELEKARKIEKIQKKKLEQLEKAAMKRLADTGSKADVKPSQKEKLTKSIVEDLELKYIHLLESYAQNKNLEKDESLFEDLCRKLIEYGVTPKGIISMHLKSMPQIKTLGDLETKRVTFESRMVLLKVMTQYASLLIINKEA